MGGHVSAIIDGTVYGDRDITLPDNFEMIHVWKLDQELKDGRERQKRSRRHF